MFISRNSCCSGCGDVTFSRRLSSFKQKGRIKSHCESISKLFADRSGVGGGCCLYTGTGITGCRCVSWTGLQQLSTVKLTPVNELRAEIISSRRTTGRCCLPRRSLRGRLEVANEPGPLASFFTGTPDWMDSVRGLRPSGCSVDRTSMKTACRSIQWMCHGPLWSAGRKLRNVHSIF